MYTLSEDFQEELANDNRNYAIQLAVTLADSTALTIENDAIWENGIEFEDAVSGDNEFQVGSAIINKMTVRLNNIYDDFSEYDFNDAVVIAYIGIIIDGEPGEYIRHGTYTVVESSGYNTSEITLECYDYMCKFEEPYGMVGTTYPASLQSILQGICTYCGVTLQTSDFYNKSYVVAARPNDEQLSCRQMVAFVAQCAASYARCDNYGRLCLKWFPLDQETPDHSFTSLYSVTSGLDQVLISGVKVIEEFNETEGQRHDEYQYGVDGYVLEISGNDLIQQGNAQAIAEAVGAKTVGLSFYTVDATLPSDPSVEAGDTAVLTDTKGREINFLITSVQFNPNGNMIVRCSAQAPARNAAAQYSELTRALVKARDTSAGQIKEYDVAVQTLTDVMAEAFGVFKTEIVNQDGSVTYIMHNKPTLNASNIQWKMTANGLAVSTDGGSTWNAGIDASGNAVMNVLNAVGVNADWVRAGKLQVSDTLGNLLFMADLDTNAVYISGDRVFIGDTSATDALAQLSGALTITLSNEMQGIPVDADGDYSTFPNVATNISVIYGATDVTQSCTLTYSEFNMSGTLVNSNTNYTYTATSLDGDTGYVSFTATYDTGTGTVQTSKRFNLYKVYAGAAGPAGQATVARMYFVESSADILKQGQDDAYVPATITFNAYYRDGDETTRYAYTGLFKVEETTDGVSWTTVEYPTENKTSTTYTPSSTNIAGVRCTLYASAEIDYTYYGLAGGDLTSVITDNDGAWFQIAEDSVVVSGGQEIDKQSVAVVKDVSALSQEEVFNILTNNSANQGLYIQNGTVYLNAAYIGAGTISASKIYGGTLVLGGNNNVNGALNIKNASGTVVGIWNNGGIQIKNTSGTTIGTWNSNGISLNGGKFAVDTNGNCTVMSMTAYGSLICYESYTIS